MNQENKNWIAITPESELPTKGLYFAFYKIEKKQPQLSLIQVMQLIKNYLKNCFRITKNCKCRNRQQFKKNKNA